MEQNGFHFSILSSLLHQLGAGGSVWFGCMHIRVGAGGFMNALSTWRLGLDMTKTKSSVGDDNSLWA